MPCGNLDHEHPPWPQQGAHEFVIEACESHCGWCGYRTKMANNLRVHARRHLTNENETRLRRIKIVKGKAGRKKVQMAKQRFPGSEARDENPYRSPSVELLSIGMSADQPGNDLDGNRSRNHPNEAFHPLLPATTTHNQDPQGLLHYQDENSLLCRSLIMRKEHRQLPLPNAAMEFPSPSKTNRTQSHCQSIPNEQRAGVAEFSGLSLRAMNHVKRLIIETLTLSDYDLSVFWIKTLRDQEQICLRDLENDLLQIPNIQSWNSIAKKLDFFLLVIRCIKNTVPFLKKCELVRPTDQPYNERYFTEVEASLTARYQLPEVARDKESGFNREERQEQRKELHSSIETLHGADNRVGNVAMIPDHRLEERSEPQERDTNESILDIAEGRSWTSSHQRSIQEAAYPPGDSSQNGTSQHLNPDLPGPVLSSLKILGYSETELDEISTCFNQLIRQYYRETQALKLRISAFDCIHKNILLPLLHRPSLQECRRSVLWCVGKMYIPVFETLRDVETHLIHSAHSQAKSSTSYLSFCNYLVRRIQILISEDGSLIDEEKTCRDQSTYSAVYFAELSDRIHKAADRNWALSKLPTGSLRDCPQKQCAFRPFLTWKKPYLIVHLQEYHNEDVGCTGEEELAGRFLHPLHWHCQHCLFLNFVPQHGYVCGGCKVPCEEFRIKARATSSSQENGIGIIQQDSPSAHASTIASSQSFEQGGTLSLDTPMEHRSQTLQPHRSLPEPVTIPRDASNAALELPVSTMASKPTSSENRHQDGIVMANQSSGSYVPKLPFGPFICICIGCRFPPSIFNEFRLHIEANHNASVIFLGGKLVYWCQVIFGWNQSCCRAEFATMSELLKHQENNHGLHSRYKQ